MQIVVPYRGSGKRRVDAPAELRAALALAMLGDVLTACVATGRTLLVSDDEAARSLADELGAEVVDDPGGGQGAAVAAALGHVDGGPALVVNADVPCVVPHDLRTLAGIAELGAIGLVEADDGTTNALALPRASLFAPLYGERQRRALSAHARRPGHDRDGRGDSEPRRRRRHARRPPARRAPGRAADAGRDDARPARRAVKVALLSGGVGGARFARGLVEAVGPERRRP